MKLKIPFQMKDIKKLNKKHLLLMGLVGVLFLVLTIPVEKELDKTKKTTMEEVDDDKETYSNTDSYRKELERQLEKILGSMEGVGRVRVMITMKDEGEVVLEKDLTKTEERTSEEDQQGTKRENCVINFQEETIYIQNDSTSSVPFVTKEVKPQVEGVLIVAQGGQNATTVKNISDAVLALFPVEAHKIKVVKMSE